MSILSSTYIPQSEHISKEEATRFLVNYHNLNNSLPYLGKEGILSYFDKVGAIQYDPLNVVGRNSDLVLQSKVKNYKPEMLKELLYIDQQLIDGFDKELCIYRTCDYPKFERIRQASGQSVVHTLSYRNQLDALTILDEVREHVKEKGPISSKDISIGVNSPGRWGHKKLSSAALDYLYTIGELSIVDKTGTRKFYDFTDKVYPHLVGVINELTDQNEFLDWYVKRRIGSVGLLWDKKGGAWQGHYLNDNKLRISTIERLLEQGNLLKFYVENIKSPFFIRKEDNHYFSSPSRIPQVKFLAPLDNMLWDRDMVAQLYNFEYRWEVYTPVEKRKYGYYVLPVLYGNKMIARFEPEKSELGKPFRMKHWWWEEGIIITKELLEAIDIAIEDFCSYLGAEYLDDYRTQIT